MPQNLTGDLSESPGGFQRRAARNMQGLAAERDKPPLLNLSMATAVRSQVFWAPCL
jgi:hypothetical protein